MCGVDVLVFIIIMLISNCVPVLYLIQADRAGTRKNPTIDTL